ncbi:glycosyltransferase, partial [Micromonospora sp. AMSO12t]
RYVILNPAYLTRLAGQKTGLWKAKAPAPATERPASFSV